MLLVNPWWLVKDWKLFICIWFIFACYLVVLYLLQASKSTAHHDEIQLGLFYTVLTEPKLASRVGGAVDIFALHKVGVIFNGLLLQFEKDIFMYYFLKID